jgi:hypothetical protein
MEQKKSLSDQLEERLIEFAGRLLSSRRSSLEHPQESISRYKLCVLEQLQLPNYAWELFRRS